MPFYLISFPAAAMQVSDAELPAVGAAAHAVIEEAKAAGVHVFAGGIDESLPPLLVAGDGAVREAVHPGSRIDGGFTILDLPTRAAAIDWARRIALACRCAQELRVFMIDPAP